MKYVVILPDGMADRPLEALGGKTPMMAAKKPNMDALAALGECGRARTLYEELPKGSDTANLSVLGYDPRLYYTGRSPVEALGLGVPLGAEDTVFRLNLVTVGRGADGDLLMLDHSAGKISDEDAFALVEALRGEFQNEEISVYNGMSYRHVLVWKNIDCEDLMTPPHDMLGQTVEPRLEEGGVTVGKMIRASMKLLEGHPVNKRRVREGLPPANCMWLWGSGKKPSYPAFKEKFGLRGAVITAVPLIRGLAAGMGLDWLSVPGATGGPDTNYRGKAQAALEALKTKDFVFVHIEAPDECGHDGDAAGKIRSIESVDRDIVGVLRQGLEGSDYKMLIMPDHATPVEMRTHTAEPVPFIIYDSTAHRQNGAGYDEDDSANGRFFEDGYTLMPYFLGKE